MYLNCCSSRWVMCAARTWGSRLIHQTSLSWWSELHQKPRCKFQNPLRYRLWKYVSDIFKMYLFWSCGLFTYHWVFVCISQGYQVSLKSTRGPIDVFLCPEDSSGVCSPVTGSSPSKPSTDSSPVLPPTQPTDQSHPRTCTTAPEVGLSSPVSTTSTASAVSQQEPSSLALGGDTGELILLLLKHWKADGIIERLSTPSTSLMFLLIQCLYLEFMFITDPRISFLN